MLKCSTCMAPGVQLGVYALLVAATVLFVTTTVHFAWQDSRSGDKSLRPSDLIKVLVNFVQYLVILRCISVPWPAFVGGMFTAATAVFGAGSGQVLSLDCWLPYYVPSKLPLAIQRQLSYFVGAFVVAVASVALICLLHAVTRVWKSRRSKHTTSSGQQHVHLQFWSRVGSTLLVTAFFAYPTLVRGALSFFACLPIDVAGKQPHPEYAIRNHTAGYWVSAVQQECFAGWHRSWALGFGLPAVLVLCLGVPVGLFAFLWRSKAKNRTADATFQEHYGFLFRNYTDSKPWWEAMWVTQTMLLTAISVFHFTIQAYYALLLMGFVVLLSAAVQVAAQPYEQPLLHKLHLASTCCLSLIVWLSLALFSESVVVDSVALGRAHNAVGSLIIAISCGFVVSCLCVIVRVASSTVISRHGSLLQTVSAGSAALLQHFSGGTASGRHPHAHQALRGNKDSSRLEVELPVSAREERAVVGV